jgi:hypothetical protein
MDEREFKERVDVLRQLVATLDVAADMVADGWIPAEPEERRYAEEAIEDLIKQTTKTLESVGFDVEQWLAEEAAVSTPNAIERPQQLRDFGSFKKEEPNPQDPHREEGRRIDEDISERRRDASRRAEASANRGDRGGGQEDER